MSSARIAYTALIYVALPVALLRLMWRGRREPGYREHVAERLGRYDYERPSEPLIWIHAVSVGETRAAEPLIEALLARYPGNRILLTHMTPTGRRAGEALFGDRVQRCYLPYDYPGAVSRFLEHFRPRVGLIMETEVWPNLIRAAGAHHIPVYLINARLSQKSFRRYARVRSLAASSLGALAGIAAQTAEDAQRLRALGAPRVEVTGNLKFDAAPGPDQIEHGREWRAGYGNRPVLLAASTRDGEEALLLDALEYLTPPEALLVIVPRHPQRFDEVAALLASRGIAYERRSGGRTPAGNARVFLGDSMGEMGAYYAACDVAFIGGSLLPFGGQNLIEACAIGKPVLLGPHTYNFSEAAGQAIEAGAALRVETAEQLMRAASDLLSRPEALAQMGEHALAFSRAHQGATARVMKMIRNFRTRSVEAAARS